MMIVEVRRIGRMADGQTCPIAVRSLSNTKWAADAAHTISRCSLLAELPFESFPLAVGSTTVRADLCLYSPESYGLEEKRGICNDMIITS
jgi:hypothetical protein